MHIPFKTIEKRIYKSANGHLSTQAGVGLYPLTGMVLIHRWNNSACLAPECNYTLVCIIDIVTPGRRRHVQKTTVERCYTRRINSARQVILPKYRSSAGKLLPPFPLPESALYAFQGRKFLLYNQGHSCSGRVH